MTEKEFKNIYSQLFPQVYKLALKITGNIHRAEDLCHDAFIVLYEKDPGIEEIEQIKYWLIRVIRNMSYNRNRRKDIEKRAYKRLENLAPVSQRSSEEDYLKIEAELAVQEALQLLPYKYRIVLILKEYEGLTYKQIGSIIGVSEANVKVRIFRGRAKLENILKERESHVP